MEMLVLSLNLRKDFCGEQRICEEERSFFSVVSKTKRKMSLIPLFIDLFHSREKID